MRAPLSPDHSGIRARRLRKRFGATCALAGADLDVDAGAIVGILGANGVGKTTLLRILATVLRPDAGSASVAGHDVIRDAQAARRSLGVAFVNERGLYWRLSAEDNLRFFARTAGLARGVARARAGELLAEMGLEGIARRRVATYSAGQRQRVILARAAIAHPAVLMLDEPMRGMDQEGVATVRAMLRARADAGAAVLITTPTMAEIDGTCDRLLMLENGLLTRARASDLATTGTAL